MLPLQEEKSMTDVSPHQISFQLQKKKKINFRCNLKKKKKTSYKKNIKKNLLLH